MRLVGDLPSSGRVEVYHDGQWGTVCDDGWELAEAQVVCRQLGFPGAISVTPGGQYGEGTNSTAKFVLLHTDKNNFLMFLIQILFVFCFFCRLWSNLAG